MNKAGIDLITSFEGFRPKPYYCPAGIISIGYGTTRYPDGRKVQMTDPPVTIEKAIQYLLNDVAASEDHILKVVTKQLNENQLSALTSFVYNCGIGNFDRSTLLKRINSNPDNPNIREQFLKWKYANVNGKPTIMPGLVRRRTVEANLYFTKL